MTVQRREPRHASKHRVLHVVGGLGVGGTETWLVKGLPACRDTEYSFDFLVHGDASQHYRSAVEKAGARVLDCPDPRHPLHYACSLLEILLKNRYDVVHAHVYCFSGFVLTLAALAGVRHRVFHGHTGGDESHAAGFRAWYFRISRWLIQQMATCGIAVSEEAARPFFPSDWRKNRRRWRISPIGIDLSAFQEPHDRSAVRTQLNLAPTDRAVVHVGRFVPVKNHDFLVDIAREALAVCPGTVFVLVGDGPGRGAVEARVSSMGLNSSFRFLGLRTDVARLLRSCDVFLLPSHYEGFPLAYVEAQAAGLPCVISDAIAPAADLVPDTTIRMSLEQPPELWALSLLRAADQPRRHELKEGLQEVSVERSMERLMECYREC